MEDQMKDFFISYTANDSKWAEWIAWQLEEAGYSVVIQAWDFRPGGNFVLNMQKAAEAERTIAVLSPDYLQKPFPQAEWAAAFAADPTGGAHNLLPVRVVECSAKGLLAQIVYIDLVNRNETDARDELLKGVNSGRAKPATAPRFPHSPPALRAIAHRPQFPGAQNIKAMSEPPVVWSIPFHRNPHFTGRDDILKGIHESFNAGEMAQALNGIGGVGKTQTALEYAYLYQQHYQYLLWCNAHSREILVTDFVSIASLLNLPEKNAQDQSEAVSAVKRWLDNNDDWLLILDNADDLAMAREFMPLRRRGHVLLTTRAQNTRPIAARQAVERMEPQEGALFLLRRLGKVKKDAPLESAPEELCDQAEALSKVLDGLPLALDQAAAFIEEKPSTLEEYQTFYQIERKELLKRRGRLAEDHPSVTVTFSLAFKRVADDNPAAADLLRVCAFLEADSIPEEIFSEGAKELGEVISSLAKSPLGLSDAIEEAGRFSLLQRNPEVRTVSLHRLVQAVLKDEMDSDTRRVWAERAVRGGNAVFPRVEYSSWATCNRLIAHAQSLASLIDEYGFDFPEAALLLNQAGNYLNKRAQYAEAEPLLKRSLDMKEKALGSEHPYTAVSLDNLAVLYRSQGRYAEAEPLLKRALAIHENALGPEHPDTAVSLNNLAAIYRSQGRYAEAEPLLQRDLAISEKALGPEHPDTATSLNGLALLYQLQRKYAEAEPLFKRSLDIYEKAFGPEHPDTAVSLNNLAAIYRSQGRYIEAEPLYRRALDICEKALGPEHPGTARVLMNYADLMRKLNRENEAAKLEARAKGIQEKTNRE